MFKSIDFKNSLKYLLLTSDREHQNKQTYEGIVHFSKYYQEKKPEDSEIEAEILPIEFFMQELTNDYIEDSILNRDDTKYGLYVLKTFVALSDLLKNLDSIESPRVLLKNLN